MIKSLLAATLLASATVAPAATLIQISGSGTWPTAATASDHIVPGAAYSFTFRIHNPYAGPTGEISNGTVDITGHRFTVGGVDVPELPDYVLFFVTSSLGAFDLAYPSEVLSFYGPDFGSTGTVALGDYHLTNIAGGTTELSITAVPEPGEWALLIAGFGLVGTAARRRRMVAA